MKGVGEMIRGEDVLFHSGYFQPRKDARGVIEQFMAVEDAEYDPDRRGHELREVMPLAIHNLAIAQQRDKERYKLVRGMVCVGFRLTLGCTECL